MDVKVITRHAPTNYGSLLQSMATVVVIEKLGYNCEIIDYQRPGENGLKAIIVGLKKKPKWNKNIIKRFLYVIIRYPDEKLGELKFSTMRKKYLKMTRPFITGDNLSELKADIFMTGSDQVWGLMFDCDYDSNYFLSFVPSDIPKIAYAASFGKTGFSDAIIAEYKEMLSKYNGITVRENKAVELLNEWNITNDGQVLDPTLLLDAEEWSKYIKKNIRGKYILVYEIHNNPLLDEYAKNFSKEFNLPLIRISAILHQIFRGGKFIYRPDIDKFLSYIKNCTYLITDSFHGTVFGLIFNKEIIEVMPNNSTGSRNNSLLQLTGLTNRIIKNETDYSVIKNEINYEQVNQIIKKEKVVSLRKMKKLLQKNCNS